MQIALISGNEGHTMRLSLCCMLGAGAATILCTLASAQSPMINADNFSIAIGGSVTNSTIINGVPQERVEDLVRARAQPFKDLAESQKETIALLKSQLELNYRQIRAALDIVGEAAVRPEQLSEKLLEISRQLKQLRDIAKLAPGDDANIASLKREAQDALDDGRLAAADALLSKVQQHQERTLAKFAANAARTSVQRARIASSQLRYIDAAKYFENAARLLPNTAEFANERLEYLQQEAKSFYNQGNDFGDTGALRLSVERYRHVVELGENLAAPPDRARNKAGLASALYSLAFRGGEHERMKEVISIYRSALDENIKHDSPAVWADINGQLGIAFVAQGVIAWDKDFAVKGLSIFQAMQNDPFVEGNMNASIFCRTGEAIALVLLATLNRTDINRNQAIQTVRALLADLPAERTFERAQFGYFLGVSLVMRGEDADLQEAANHLRAVLVTVTKKRMPMMWAQMQAALGNALGEISRRSGSTDRLKQALAAYHAALTELTPERNASDWMAVQFFIGGLCLHFGALKSDTDLVSQAVDAYSTFLAHKNLIPPAYVHPVEVSLEQAKKLLADLNSR